MHDEDVHVALREAFDDMRRQVEDSVRRVRGEEELHASTRGEVVRFAEDGHCGFIRTAEGDEYWFGPENMAGAPFEHLVRATMCSSFPTRRAWLTMARIIWA